MGLYPYYLDKVIVKYVVFFHKAQSGHRVIL